MAGEYVTELFRRVFYPTHRGADYLSVIIPLMIAAVAYFSGVQVSENTTTEILAYVGVFTILVLLLRLFVTAPYAMWKEQVAVAGDLRLQLTKPERKMLEHLAKHRADARMEIAKLLSDLHAFAFANDIAVAKPEIVKIYSKIGRLQAQAHTSAAFQTAKTRFSQLVEARINNKIPETTYPDYNLLSQMVAYLHGEVSPEALALAIPAVPQ